MVASQRRRKNGRRSSQSLLYHQTSSGGVGAGVNLTMFTIPTGRQKLHPQPLPYLPTSPTRTQCLTLVYLFTRRCARAVVALARIFWLLSTSLSQQLISILPQSPTPGYARVGVPPTPSPTVVRIAMLSASLSVPVPSPRGVFLGASQSSALLYVWTFSSINQDVTS